MTPEEFGALLATVDPDVRENYSTKRGDYTVWEKTTRLSEYADGINQGGWRCVVERYTRDPHDPIAEKLSELLGNDDRIGVQEMQTGELEDEGVYIIRHIYDCEVI